MSITIVNKHKSDEGIYVGRPTALGNPFTVKEFGKGNCINKYEERLWACMATDNPVRRGIVALTDRYVADGALTLACWCAPAPCHAEVIARMIEWLIVQRNKFRVAVVGSRKWDDWKLVDHVLDQYVKLNMNENGMTLISGGAKGADTCAAEYAAANQMDIIIIPADWKKHGRSAGYKRNHEIWAMAHEGVAFWDGQSKGTEHSFKIARDLDKPLRIIQSWEDI
jgi:hypothetical protein